MTDDELNENLPIDGDNEVLADNDVATEEDADFESSGDYKIKLSNFEGPLDLLLHLIKKAKIQIKDIFVSQVTQQFLEFIADIDSVDFDKYAEYMQMAATLLEIKSRALLPKIEEDLGPDEEAYDPEGELIRKLEEYRLYKEASEKLKNMDNRDIFYKQPESDYSNVRVVYSDFNFSNLMSAFEKMLRRVTIEEKEKANKKEILKDEFTVNDQMELIKTMTFEHKKVMFTDLFKDARHRSEVITTFQALLELLRLQYICVSQETMFGDIEIVYNENRPIEEEVDTNNEQN